MTPGQKIVGIGAASGIAAMIVAIAGIYQLWPSSPSLVDISSRLLMPCKRMCLLSFHCSLVS